MNDKFKAYFQEVYDNSDVIIPPPSILDGSAPVCLFNEYIGSVDLSKLRMRDLAIILEWIHVLTGASPADLQRRAEEERMKEAREYGTS